MTDGPFTTITVEEYNRLRAVVRAADGLAIAKYGFGIPITSSPERAKESFDQIMAAIKPLSQALLALHKLDQGGDRSQGGLSNEL